MRQGGQPARRECVVVGGGIIGLALAHALCERGCGVLVLERDEPGCGATAAAAGMLAPVSEADTAPDALIALAKDSLGRYPEAVRRWERDGGIDCAYRTDGTLWIATSRDEQEELEHLAQTVRLKGLEARPLSAKDVLQREPHLSPRVLGGLLVESDHQIDPRAASRCLVTALRSRGVQVAAGAQVTEIVSGARGVVGVRGRSRAGAPFEVRADTVVLAAGAWSGRDLRVPLDDLGLRPVKGQVLRLRGEPLLSHVVRTPDVYLVPRADGELIVGATTEEMGFDLSPTAGAAMDLLRHAFDALPGIYDLHLEETSVGLRPALSDHLPRIGATEVDGLYLAVGHYRQGILLAAATAEHLAGWIDCGEMPAELARFAPPHAVRSGR